MHWILLKFLSPLDPLIFSSLLWITLKSWDVTLSAVWALCLRGAPGPVYAEYGGERSIYVLGNLIRTPSGLPELCSS